ncbi:MAG: ERCC4 domain-containing protein [Planctomycetota bacterium]
MARSDPSPPNARLRVVVDDREGASRLPGAVAAAWANTLVGRLPVGDVQVGERILVERKTLRDFVSSLEDGRLFRQAHALNAACRRPLILLEGEDAFDLLGLSGEALRGVLLSLLVGYRIPVFRTDSVLDTAATVGRIARQEARRIARAAARRRGPTPGRKALDVLGCVPGVGDLRARSLVDEFGSVRKIAQLTEEQLVQAKGIGPATAKNTARAMRGDGP